MLGSTCYCHLTYGIRIENSHIEADQINGCSKFTPEISKLWLIFKNHTICAKYDTMC